MREGEIAEAGSEDRSARHRTRRIRRVLPENGGNIVPICLMILTVLAIVYTMHLASSLLLPTVVACLAAVTLTPLVARLEHWGIPNALASTLVMIGVLVGIFAMAWAISPSYETWRARAPNISYEIERKLRRIEDVAQEVKEVTEDIVPAKKVKARAAGEGDGAAPAEEEGEELTASEQLVETTQRMTSEFIAAAPQRFGQVIYAGFLTLFLLIERGKLQRGIMAVAVRTSARLRIVRAMKDLRHKVSQYLATITVVNMGLGLASGLSFWYWGLPNPLLFGMLMGLANFVPYLGPMIMNVVILAVGFITFPSAEQAIWPVLTLVVINMIEGQIVTPMVLGAQLTSSALAAFVAIAFGAWLWGPVGAIVATPTLIVIETVLRRIYDFRHGKRARKSSRSPAPPKNVAARSAA